MKSLENHLRGSLVTKKGPCLAKPPKIQESALSGNLLNNFLNLAVQTLHFIFPEFNSGIKYKWSPRCHWTQMRLLSHLRLGQSNIRQKFGIFYWIFWIPIRTCEITSFELIFTCRPIHNFFYICALKGPFHTTLGKLENEALFQGLGLSSALNPENLSTDIGAFRIRSSNRRNLKTPTSRFSEEGNHFETSR